MDTSLSCLFHNAAVHDLQSAEYGVVSLTFVINFVYYLNSFIFFFLPYLIRLHHILTHYLSRIMVMDAGVVQEFSKPGDLLADKTSLFYGMAKDAGLV